MDKKMLERINELAKKKKEQGLTEAETKSRKSYTKFISAKSAPNSMQHLTM